MSSKMSTSGVSPDSVNGASSTSTAASKPKWKGQRVLKPVRFDDETFVLVCEWEDCNFATTVPMEFSEHVSSHIPGVEVGPPEFNGFDDVKPGQIQTLSVCLFCKWMGCSFRSLFSIDLQRHLFLHAYHTRLKCIGYNTTVRCNLNTCTGNEAHRNVLPDLSDNLRCAWGTCSDRFVNIQEYYDHIRYHCEDERGNHNSQPIRCRWTGCSSKVSNVTKLKDHMRSHTQEKLLACPACGSLFSNRTRYFDHCRRQILVGMDAQLFTCETCRKCFPTERLHREHVRSHVNKYPCRKCGMECPSLSTLNHHMRYKHSKERPYKCAYCNYTAKYPADISKHCAVHDNTMLRCEEPGCSYHSKAAANLQNHIDKVHRSMKESKYACHLCENKYFKGAYLSKHLITVHKLQWPPGHSRFRYRLWQDGLHRLITVDQHQLQQQHDQQAIEAQNIGAASSSTNTKMETIDIKHHVQIAN